MTVRQVGKEAGISYSLVSKFEKGSRIPTLVILQKIQGVLDMNDREFQELIQIRNKSESSSSVNRKGGGDIQWKVIEAVREFKSIYPIM
ncbi:helix-turn-helix transcriptional regulator [Candidatus Microgenomates bacterium]|nr:helix-turn-helix transcriptional regulator [Candidatus Microgenomates bacterium]